MPKITLTYKPLFKAYIDKEGNVWVKDLEPGYKLRAEIEDLKRQLQELQR
jgi:hypothetical protein